MLTAVAVAAFVFTTVSGSPTEPKLDVSLQGLADDPPVVEGSLESGGIPEPWRSLSECESGGDWSIDTGNGFSGGLQWHPSSWARWKDADDPEYAWQASWQQEVAAGERYVAAERAEGRGGYGPWPACADRLSLSR